MTDPFTDPVEHAAQIRSGHEGGGFGVTHDALVEARIEADWMYTQARRQAVDLDGMADDMGLYPMEVRASLRDAQKRMQAIAEWAERFADALEAEIEDLVAEHEA